MKRVVALKMTDLNAPLYGAYLINKLWVENIIRYGEFDEYHLFGSPTDQDVLQRNYQADPRVHVFTWQDLPDLMRMTDYIVLQTFGVKACHLYSLRDRLCQRPFPICSITHSLSYQEVFDYMLINMATHRWPFDTFICGTQASRRALVEMIRKLRNGRAFRDMTLSESHIHVIPHGIDSQAYSPLCQADCRRELGLPDHAFVILSVGRLSFSDKIDYRCLIEAFSLLGQRCHMGRDLILCLAGDDKFAETRRIYAMARQYDVEKQIKVFANFPDSQKWTLYRAADVFVSLSNSVQESFGITLLEAMSSGLPMIVSDWDGYRDIVQHEKNGLVVPTRWRDRVCPVEDLASVLPWRSLNETMAEAVVIDPRAVAEQLQRVLVDPSLGDRLREAALEAVQAYAWSRVVPALITHWLAMYEKSRRMRVVEAPVGTWYALDLRHVFGHYVSESGEDNVLPEAATREGSCVT